LAAKHTLTSARSTVLTLECEVLTAKRKNLTAGRTLMIAKFVEAAEKDTVRNERL
jgi:hypothetical protein